MDSSSPFIPNDLKIKNKRRRRAREMIMKNNHKSFLFLRKNKFGSFWSLKMGTGAHEPENAPVFYSEFHFRFRFRKRRSSIERIFLLIKGVG